MKKRITFLFILFILNFPIMVNAATGSVRASVSSSKVTLNNTFNVTVRVSSDTTIGSWQFNVEYDSSKVSLQSGDVMVVGYGDGSFSSKSYTYRFKAVGLGSATISITGAKIADYDTVSYMSTSSGGTTVNISEPVNIVYSSDNNLSSLGIEDVELNPIFNKNTLEYTATLAPGATTVKINAKASNNKARISGIGNIEVEEGENTLPIVVTAENGATKTYTLKLIVPEKEPLIVGKYKISRKIPEDKPLYFNEKTIQINEEEVAVLYNEKLNITLVYASDSTNKYNYYEFKNNQVINKFISLNSGAVSIRINEEDNQTIKKLKKHTLKIDNIEIKNAYKVTGKSQYYIIYGTDLVTGKSNFYSYDSLNKTLQIFDQDSYKVLIDNLNDKNLIIYGLGGSLLVLLLITILLGRNKSKLKKIEKKIENKKSNE